MIVLHHTGDDSMAKEIKNTLDDLVVAYKEQIHHHSATTPHPLPCIEQNGKIISKEDYIKEFLWDLKTDLQQQRSVSGDACYIHPETGEVC